MATKVIICLVLLCFIGAHECGKVLSGFMGGGMEMPSWVRYIKKFPLFLSK